MPSFRFLPLNPVAVACADPVHIRVLSRPYGNVFQPMAFNPIVGIKEAHPLAFCDIEGYIACGADAGVRLVDDAETLVLCGVFVKDCARAISRTVVHAERFPVRKGLRTDGIEALAMIRCDIVDGDDDGEKRHGSILLKDGRQFKQDRKLEKTRSCQQLQNLAFKLFWRIVDIDVCLASCFALSSPCRIVRKMREGINKLRRIVVDEYTVSPPRENILRDATRSERGRYAYSGIRERFQRLDAGSTSGKNRDHGSYATRIQCVDIVDKSENLDIGNASRS